LAEGQAQWPVFWQFTIQDARWPGSLALVERLMSLLPGELGNLSSKLVWELGSLRTSRRKTEEPTVWVGICWEPVGRKQSRVTGEEFKLSKYKLKLADMSHGFKWLLGVHYILKASCSSIFKWNIVSCED